MKTKDISIYIYSVLLSIAILLTIEIGDSTVFPLSIINNCYGSFINKLPSLIVKNKPLLQEKVGNL